MTTESSPVEPVPPTDAPRRATRVATWVGTTLACCAMIVAACRYQRAAPPGSEKPQELQVQGDTIVLAKSSPWWNSLQIESARPASERWTESIAGRVRIDDRLSSKVGAPLPGRVSRVFADLGQQVKEGDPLFSITSPDLAELQAQEQKAELDLEAAKLALDRVEAIVARDALPAKERASALQQWKQASVSRDLVRRKLSALHIENATDNVYVVRAPRDGVVVEKALAPDQQILQDGSAASLVTIASLHEVWVVGELFEADATLVKEGTRAEVGIPGLPGKRLQATVETVAAVVDPARHTVALRVRVPNPDRALRPNAYVNLRLLATPDPESCEVPAAALVSNGAKQFVYVAADDKKLTRREVVCGPNVGDAVTIVSGLARGERVVAEGAILLDNQIDLSR